MEDTVNTQTKILENKYLEFNKKLEELKEYKEALQDMTTKEFMTRRKEKYIYTI